MTTGEHAWTGLPIVHGLISLINTQTKLLFWRERPNYIDIMPLNFDAGEDSWEFPGQQGDQTSES